MKPIDLTRRAFLASVTTTAIAAQGAPNSAKVVPRKVSPNEKLNLAGIGVGGEGFWDLRECGTENIVAFCDVDWDRAKRAFEAWPKARPWRDYRNMLEEMPEIDAVLVATPDHNHALIGYAAMMHGKHLFLQKPLTRTIAEAAFLAKVAKETGVVTQMGNQGHSGNGMRELCEMVWTGAVGPVREAHIWTARPTWPGHGEPAALPAEVIPEGMDWDRWIGCAAWRPYNGGYAPKAWRAWKDFGGGALGDMGCHIMDPVYMALKLHEAPSYSVEVVELEGASTETFPTKTTFKYTFPARGGMPPVAVYWYDGFDVDPDTGDKTPNRPKRPEGVPEDQVLGHDGENGSFLVGDAGVVTAGEYGEKPRLMPDERMADYAMPEPILERVPDQNHKFNFFDAIKDGGKAVSDFSYAAPFTQFVQLGNLALDLGKKLEWDNQQARLTNVADPDAVVTRAYRKGWELPC